MDSKGLACQILFAHEDALPTFVADTVKYKGEHPSRAAGTLNIYHTLDALTWVCPECMYEVTNV